MIKKINIEEIKKRNKVTEVDNPRPQLELEIDYPIPKQNSKLPEDDWYGKVITIDLDTED